MNLWLGQTSKWPSVMFGNTVRFLLLFEGVLFEENKFACNLLFKCALSEVDNSRLHMR